MALGRKKGNQMVREDIFTDVRVVKSASYTNSGRH